MTSVTNDELAIMRRSKWEFFRRIGYEPIASQREFHSGPQRFKVIFGGERAGKSMCAARDLGVELLSPGYRLWILGSQYSSIEGCFSWFWHDFVEPILDIRPPFPKGRCLECKPTRAVRNTQTHDYYLRFAWGAEIVAKSAKNLAGVRALPVNGLIATEAADMPENTWDDYARGRVSDREGRAVIEGCPVGFNWFADLGERGRLGDPDWATFRLNAEETLPAADLAEKRRNYSDSLYEQKVRGNPMSKEGLVYIPPFHKEESLMDWEYRADWLTWLGVDFGYRFPALVWAQTNGANPLDPGFRGVTFDQFVEDNVSMDGLIEAIFGRPYALAGIFCDPAGDGADGTGFSDLKRLRAECQRRGVASPSTTTSPRWRHVPTGVERTRALWQSADGERRWFLGRRLADNSVRRGMWRALHMYQYPDARRGSKSDMPVKDGISDHVMDADRYIKIGLFERGSIGACPPRGAPRPSLFGPSLRRALRPGPGGPQHRGV